MMIDYYNSTQISALYASFIKKFKLFKIKAHLSYLQPLNYTIKMAWNKLSKMDHYYYTHRGSRFDCCVGLSYLIQKMRESSSLKTASPISYS